MSNKNRMNASDIIKSKQNRVLFQAYYRPTIFASPITSTINYYPISTISTGGSIFQSRNSTVTTQYQYTCEKPIISYELANSIENGKYLCGYPTCSTISVWNTGETIPIGTCDCKISVLSWKNNTTTALQFYSTVNYSSVSTFTTAIPTGSAPLICPFTSFYQGTSFTNQCNACTVLSNCTDCNFN